MSCSEGKAACHKASSMAGSMLIFFFGRPMLYWGNLSVYMMSYLLSRGEPNYPIQPTWFLLCYSLSWSLGTLLTETMSRILDVRFRIFLGITLYNFCFFGSVFAARVSWMVYVVAFGTCSGLGIGMLEIPILRHYIIDWSYTDHGLLTTIYLASGSAGGAILNLFMSWYLNPDDIAPNVETAGVKLFFNDLMFDRIQRMFYVVGGTSLAFQILGFCLLRENKGDGDDQERALSTTDYNTFDRRGNLIDIDMDPFDTARSGASTSSQRNVTQIEDDNMSVLDLFRSPEFWKLWFLYFSASHSRILINAYYKFYGLVWIPDDLFLTDIGTGMSVSAIFSTFIWGVIMDSFGVRTCLITLFTLVSAVCPLMYYTSSLNKWAYFGVTILGLNITYSAFFCFVISTATIFGTNHLDRNVALINTAPLVTYSVSSVVLEYTLERFDWIFPFGWVTGWCILGLIVAMFVTSHTIKNEL